MLTWNPKLFLLEFLLLWPIVQALASTTIAQENALETLIPLYFVSGSQPILTIESSSQEVMTTTLHKRARVTRSTHSTRTRTTVRNGDKSSVHSQRQSTSIKRASDLTHTRNHGTATSTKTSHISKTSSAGSSSTPSLLKDKFRPLDPCHIDTDLCAPVPSSLKNSRSLVIRSKSRAYKVELDDDGPEFEIFAQPFPSWKDYLTKLRSDDHARKSQRLFWVAGDNEANTKLQVSSAEELETKDIGEIDAEHIIERQTFQLWIESTISNKHTIFGTSLTRRPHLTAKWFRANWSNNKMKDGSFASVTDARNQPLTSINDRVFHAIGSTANWEVLVGLNHGLNLLKARIWEGARPESSSKIGKKAAGAATGSSKAGPVDAHNEFKQLKVSLQSRDQVFEYLGNELVQMQMKTVVDTIIERLREVDNVKEYDTNGELEPSFKEFLRVHLDEMGKRQVEHLKGDMIRIEEAFKSEIKTLTSKVTKEGSRAKETDVKKLADTKANLKALENIKARGTKDMLYTHWASKVKNIL